MFRNDRGVDGGTSWSQVSKLSKSAEPAYSHDYFGWSVSVYGNIVAASPLSETVSGVSAAGKAELSDIVRCALH